MLPSISLSSGSTLEEPATNGKLRITRSGASNLLPLTVNLSYAGSSAIRGVDYASLPTSVTFGVLQDFVELNVNVIDDSETEDDEIIFISVVPNALLYQLGTTNQISITILDDDFIL